MEEQEREIDKNQRKGDKRERKKERDSEHMK